MSSSLICSSLTCTSFSQHVPLPEYKTNLGSIVDNMRNMLSPSCAIILISPPPMDAEAWVKHSLNNNRTLEQSDAYRKACSEVAMEKKTHFVDAWQAIMNSKDWKECLCDGLHLSGEGNDILYQEVLKSIQTNVPEMLPDALSLDAPLYDTIDADDYHSSFSPYL